MLKASANPNNNQTFYVGHFAIHLSSLLTPLILIPGILVSSANFNAVQRLTYYANKREKVNEEKKLTKQICLQSSVCICEVTVGQLLVAFMPKNISILCGS